MTPEDVERSLILGRGWVKAIETGKVQPTLDAIASMLSVYGKTLSDLASGMTGSVPHISRPISAEAVEDGLEIKFDYAKHDASYRLGGASLDQFADVMLTLTEGLARLTVREIDEDEPLLEALEDEEGNLGGEIEKAIKTGSVANTFLRAVELWPHANPSDLWWFIVYRAYCDRYSHPSKYSRLDMAQSWRRTGGWALETILEKHYGPFLAEQGVNLVIANSARKARLLAGVDVGHRLEADKVDVFLTVGEGENEKMIGVVHVKASFAERRTDDVPMSEALVAAGYISPLWTMDCKSMPSAHPVNRGELGVVFDGRGVDGRSAKRKDIEDDGFFSACFSYNRNTRPTPASFRSRARVHVCDFTDPNDSFSAFILAERKRFKEMFGI